MDALKKREGTDRISRASETSKARPDGFEPPTTWFEARCSIQLSYGRVGGKFSGFALRTEAAVTVDRAGAFAPPRRNQSSWRRSNETRIKYLRRQGAPLAAGGPKVVRSLVGKHHSYR